LPVAALNLLAHPGRPPGTLRYLFFCLSFRKPKEPLAKQSVDGQIHHLGPACQAQTVDGSAFFPTGTARPHDVSLHPQGSNARSDLDGHPAAWRQPGGQLDGKSSAANIGGSSPENP
jgi:hypothetical protein